MKVLHVIDSLGRGGAEQLLVTLLPELGRQGVEVALAVRGGTMELAPALESEGVSLHRLAPRHRWNLVGMARELAALARAEGADVVHAHLYFPAVGVALMRLLRLGHARTCVTFHNLAYAGANRHGVGLEIRRRLARVLYPLGIDGFFGVSAAVAHHYESSLSLRRVAVLRNPADIPGLRRIAGEVTAEPGRIVLPGRIVPEKGHADLLEALALLAHRGLRPAVTIAGDGPLRGKIEAQADALNLRSQIDFTGALEHTALLRAVAAGSIVVVPSRFEGFGLTALEAMALGRAVIASRAGGLPEVVGDAGLLVPVADPPALAEALAALLADSARYADLGARAADRARGFDLPQVAARQIAAYRELLASSSPASKVIR